MQKCIKCSKVDGVIKSGRVRGKQRFFCKECKFNFVLDHKPIQVIKKSGHITLSDLAQHLGISVSTVSKALNDKSDINFETKKLVIQAANDLNYQPNHLAQSLHQGESHIIGVIVPDIEHHYFAKVLAGIHNIINDTKYSIIVCHSNESNDLESLHVDKLLSYRVDGILISHVKKVTTFTHLEKIRKHNIPLVQFDRIIEEYQSPQVQNNDIQGSFETVSCLIKNGFKKIAIILGVKDLDISEKRFKGYQNAMNAYNLHIPDDYIQYSNLVKDNIKHALDTLLNLDSPPDAIFTAFIKDGIEVINQAKKLNIKIPSQLGVAAFGEDEIAKLIEPSLTTYNPNPVKVGEESISILLDLINSPSQNLNIKKIVTGFLFERKSSQKK